MTKDYFVSVNSPDLKSAEPRQYLLDVLKLADQPKSVTKFDYQIPIFELEQNCPYGACSLFALPYNSVLAVCESWQGLNGLSIATISIKIINLDIFEKQIKSVSDSSTSWSFEEIGHFTANGKGFLPEAIVDHPMSKSSLVFTLFARFPAADGPNLHLLMVSFDRNSNKWQLRRRSYSVPVARVNRITAVAAPTASPTIPILCVIGEKDETSRGSRGVIFTQSGECLAAIDYGDVSSSVLPLMAAMDSASQKALIFASFLTAGSLPESPVYAVKIEGSSMSGSLPGDGADAENILVPLEGAPAAELVADCNHLFLSGCVVDLKLTDSTTTSSSSFRFLGGHSGLGKVQLLNPNRIDRGEDTRTALDHAKRQIRYHWPLNRQSVTNNAYCHVEYLRMPQDGFTKRINEALILGRYAFLAIDNSIALFDWLGDDPASQGQFLWRLYPFSKKWDEDQSLSVLLVSPEGNSLGVVDTFSKRVWFGKV